MSKIEPKSFELKDGTPAQLRSGTESDIEAFEAHVQAVLADGTGMTALPGEIDSCTEKRLAKIRKLTGHDDKLLIVAVVGSNLVGNLDFQAGKRKRLSHCGGFGVSVHPDWRGQGIGKAMLDTMIEWAISNPRIEKITLDVLGSNAPAIRLYEHLGFVEEGRKSKAIKFEDGSYDDDVQMSRFV